MPCLCSYGCNTCSSNATDQDSSINMFIRKEQLLVWEERKKGSTELTNYNQGKEEAPLAKLALAGTSIPRTLLEHHVVFKLDS